MEDAAKTDVQLDALLQLASVTKLSVGGDAVNDTTAGQLAQLTNLQDLTVTDAKRLTDLGLCCLTQLTALTNLTVSGCSLSLELLGHPEPAGTIFEPQDREQSGFSGNDLVQAFNEATVCTEPSADTALDSFLMGTDNMTPFLGAAVVARGNLPCAASGYSFTENNTDVHIERATQAENHLHIMSMSSPPTVSQQLRERCMNSRTCLQLMLQQRDEQLEQQKANTSVAQQIAAWQQQQVAELQQQVAKAQTQLAQVQSSLASRIAVTPAAAMRPPGETAATAAAAAPPAAPQASAFAVPALQRPAHLSSAAATSQQQQQLFQSLVQQQQRRQHTSYSSELKRRHCP